MARFICDVSGFYYVGQINSTLGTKQFRLVGVRLGVRPLVRRRKLISTRNLEFLADFLQWQC
jgi:hypothetical protein